MKRIISICLILLTILCSSAFATDFDDDVKPRNPRLMIEEFATMPTVEAGETLSMILKIKNISNYTASNVTITPSFDNVPLVYEKPIIVSLENSVRAHRDTSTNFNFKVKNTAKLGVYGISFKLQYVNLYDEIFNVEQKVYFKVVKEHSDAMITVSDIKTSLDKITPNSKFDLSFNLNNIGTLDAKKLKVQLSGFDKSEFIAFDSEDTKYVGTINGMDSYNVSFSLLASDKIVSGTHSVTADIIYINADDETETKETKTIYITNVVGEKEIDTSDSSGSGTPKVMISSYRVTPNAIKAGDIINFSFTFTNTNRSKSIKNMVITVSSSTDGAFSIANGSNTFYIESMGPKTSITKSITLNVKQDLASKSYPVNINFNYEDSKDNNFTSDETINLPVTEYSKLVINNVYVGEAYVDGNANLSFDYINMGKAVVSNLTASLEGDYKSAQPINYIGNLNAGTSDYYEIEVIPTKEGDNFGTLVLSFEDSSGKIIEERKTFQGFAMGEISDNSEDNPTPYDPDMPAEGDSDFHLSVWAIIGIGVATLLVSFIVTKIIVKKILNKKLEDEM